MLHTQQIAAKIGPVLFIDPVTFLLHLPDVAYNFVRGLPKLPYRELQLTFRTTF